MTIRRKLIDELHKDYETPQDILGDGGLLKELAKAVNLQGHTELLGMWVAQTEEARFWLSVLTELQNRGVKDLFIACVDGLTRSH